MGKYILALPLLLFICGCTSVDREVEKEVIETSLSNKDVQASLSEIIEILNQFEKDLEKKADKEIINKYGQQIEEKWDSIEKQVETKYPDEYVNVEKSLYPLIGEAKSPEFNLEKVKVYLKESIFKISNLKEKWGSH
ncbi:hypothetical protein [Peribacillus acanthi]|uniref:hypothetical protein n=1 Tax=Peribacillus acanthi TaxID=2171554 RepID=UPI000D3EB4AD|nr:hypothetical protein [Peribacillus acanthi]